MLLKLIWPNDTYLQKQNELKLNRFKSVPNIGEVFCSYLKAQNAFTSHPHKIIYIYIYIPTHIRIISQNGIHLDWIIKRCEPFWSRREPGTCWWADPNEIPRNSHRHKECVHHSPAVVVGVEWSGWTSGQLTFLAPLGFSVAGRWNWDGRETELTFQR